MSFTILPRRLRHLARGLLVLASMAALPGCRTSPGPIPDNLSGAEPSPAEETRPAPAGMTAAQLQATLFGYADTYIALTSQAADNLVWKDKSPDRRQKAIRAKLDGAEAVVEIVTGPNPTVALLDLAVMVTLQRQIWEDFWSGQFGEDAYNFTESIKRLETEIWGITAQVMTPAQCEDLRRLAGDIRQQYIHQVYVTSLRASRITSHLSESKSGIHAPKNLLTLFGLDPLAGISPALVEVAKARLLAERTFYYAQKLPELLTWRMELTTTATLTTPEASQILTNAHDAVQSALRLAALAESLPGQVTAERTAALDQAAGLIAAERAALLKALDDRQQEAHAVLTDLRATLDAADQLTRSVRGVMADLQSMRPASAGAPAEEPGRPFDIREYQQTLETATGTLVELNKAVAQARELLSPAALDAPGRAAAAVMRDAERSLRSLLLVACGGLALALFLGLSGAHWVRRRLDVRDR
ncbi:MAG: hypothetical protein U1F77_08995 [Kiritimatiellia bacterium]